MSVNVNIQGLIIPTILYVVNDLHPKLILGNDWLKNSRAVIDYRTGVLSLFYDLIQCPLEGFNSMHNCVTLRQTVCLQPYSESILPVQVPHKFNNRSVLIEPFRDQSALSVSVAGTMCTTHGFLKIDWIAHRLRGLKRGVRPADTPRRHLATRIGRLAATSKR